MDTLIGEYNIRLNILDQEVHDTIISGEDWKTYPQFAEHDLKLKEQLEIFNKNLIKSKDFKFEHDRTRTGLSMAPIQTLSTKLPIQTQFQSISY